MASTRLESEAFEDEGAQAAEQEIQREEQAKPEADAKLGAFRALQNRNFRIFWIGQLISLIGTWAQSLAQGWLIVLLVDPVASQMLRHGGSAVGSATGHHSPAVEAAANFYSGWVNFAGGLPIFLFTLLAGVVADRVDKRKMLLVTQSGLIFCALGLGILASEGKVQIWHVLLFATLSGLFAAFDMPTRQSFIVEMVTKKDVPSAVALNSSIFNAARALGPAVAGLLLAAQVSIGAAFLGNAFLSLAVIAGLLMIRIPSKDQSADQAKADNTLRGVWNSTR
ncbi:MAG: MFS transporter, partial [Janthinobacterium lividum]